MLGNGVCGVPERFLAPVYRWGGGGFVQYWGKEGKDRPLIFFKKIFFNCSGEILPRGGGGPGGFSGGKRILPRGNFAKKVFNPRFFFCFIVWGPGGKGGRKKKIIFFSFGSASQKFFGNGEIFFFKKGGFSAMGGGFF